IQRFLGVKGELGMALGLDDQWTYRIVKQVGNYGEVFERNLGKSSAPADGARAERSVDPRRAALFAAVQLMVRAGWLCPRSARHAPPYDSAGRRRGGRGFR